MNFDDATTIGSNPVTVWALNVVGCFLTVVACMGYSSVRGACYHCNINPCPNPSYVTGLTGLTRLTMLTWLTG